MRSDCAHKCAHSAERRDLCQRVSTASELLRGLDLFVIASDFAWWVWRHEHRHSQQYDERREDALEHIPRESEREEGSTDCPEHSSGPKEQRQAKVTETAPSHRYQSHGSGGDHECERGRLGLMLPELVKSNKRGYEDDASSDPQERRQRPDNHAQRDRTENAGHDKRRYAPVPASRRPNA